MIQVEPLVEIYDCDDRGIEPIGFYCEGHINPTDFLKSEVIQDYLGEKNEDKDLDIEPQELTIEPEQVQHTYWRVKKCDFVLNSTATVRYLCRVNLIIQMRLQ